MHSFQLELLAYDTQYPSEIAYTNITIVVNRNPNAPVFNQQIYERTVTEDFTIGFSLVQLDVSDADGVIFLVYFHLHIELCCFL